MLLIIGLVHMHCKCRNSANCMCMPFRFMQLGHLFLFIYLLMCNSLVCSFVLVLSLPSSLSWYFVGEKGRRIRELTSVVQKRFNFPENSVELYAEKVNNRGLCAIAQAESLRYKLLGGLAVRRYLLMSFFFLNIFLWCNYLL